MTIAWTYSTSFDTGGVAATNAQTTINAFKTTITSQAAWSTVEDVTIGSGNWRWLVFKNDHTVSGLPSDFYVGFIGQTSSASVQMFVAEGYVSGGSRTITKYAPSTSVSSTASVAMNASDGTIADNITASGTTGAQVIAGTGNTLGAANFNLIFAAANAYWVVVYNDHIVIGTSTTGTSYYFGGFTSFVTSAATNDPMPLVAMTLTPTGSTSQVAGTTTRHPLQAGRTSSLTNQWGVYTALANSPTPQMQTHLSCYPAIGAFGYAVADLFQGSTTPLSEIMVAQASGSTTVASLGYARGKYNDMRAMTPIPNGMQNGDQITYNGTHWMMVSASSTSIGAFVDLGF
jgi:hypothetical protein